MKKIAVVGGGLAGLIAAIGLLKKGISCVLYEKKQYPFHRVCGEYISEETVPFLKSLDIFPESFHPARINRLQLTSVSGKSAEVKLDLGGFGISRFSFDHFLYQRIVELGGEVKQNIEITQIDFINNVFRIHAHEELFFADVVIGSFGKRSKLDKSMKRKFVEARSPYVGVKYHVFTDHPADVIALHNFKNGYCGISRIEDGKSNLCYLTHRDNLKRFGNIQQMEREVLFRNPFLKTIFNKAEFLFDKPETINEISFAEKTPVENHVLMCGDSAGMITPLCGNGMAMAIHAAKIVSELVTEFCEGKLSRDALEQAYHQQWKQNFAMRLRAGRAIQNLFGSEFASNVAVNLARHVPPVANFLIKKTHGNAF